MVNEKTGTCLPGLYHPPAILLEGSFWQYKPNRQYLAKFNQSPVFANKMIPIANKLRRNFPPFVNQLQESVDRNTGFFSFLSESYFR